jgi:hypothetical protein
MVKLSGPAVLAPVRAKIVSPSPTFLPPLPKCKPEDQKNPFLTLLQLGVVAPGLNNFVAQSGSRSKKVFYFMSLQHDGLIAFKGATLDLSDGSEPKVSIKTKNLQRHKKLKIDARIQQVLRLQFPNDGFAKFATPSAAVTWVKSYASGRAQTSDGWNNFYYGTIRMDHFRSQYPKAFRRKKPNAVYSRKGIPLGPCQPKRARPPRQQSIAEKATYATVELAASTYFFPGEPSGPATDQTKKPTKKQPAIDHSLLAAATHCLAVHSKSYCLA